MPSTQIVTQGNSARAQIPRSSPPQTYLLPFGKNCYHVPASAIKSYPKYANEEIKTGEDLGALINTKSPEKWLPYCEPDVLCRIEGDTGNCVYTTFDVPGWPYERRFLRLISATVAEKNFDKVKKKALEQTEAQGVELNERQKKRMDVLSWNKKTHCPNRAQINPEIEKWEIATPAEAVASCLKPPETKKRAKPNAGQEGEASSKRKQYICHEELIKQPPGTTYKINEVNGLLHVLFYRTAATMVEEEEDDADDQ